jgi:hypothetical protein
VSEEQKVDFVFTLPFGSASEAKIDQMMKAMGPLSADMSGQDACNYYYAPIRKVCVEAGLEEVEQSPIGALWRGTMPQVMAAAMALPDWAQGFAWPVKDDEQPES